MLTLSSSRPRVGLLVGLLALVSLAASGCDSDGNDDDNDGSTADPTGNANANQLAVLEKLVELGARPVSELSTGEARTQFSVADAVRGVLQDRGQSAAPEPVGNVENRTIEAPGVPPLTVRIYTPAGTGPFPIIVYFHGGGWVVATIDTYDASARALTNAAQAIVMSVEYRKGPEAKFPAAHEDAFAAYRWVVENAASIGGDPARLAVAGESAGGNLAANVALRARDEGVTEPLHQLLVYPVAGNDLSTESYIENANARPLSRPDIEWFLDRYLNTESESADPRINLVGREDFEGVAPATIIAAQIDPLTTEGERLEERLAADGVDVERYYFEGVAHEFFGTGAVVPEGLEAVGQAGARLRAAFGG